MKFFHSKERKQFRSLARKLSITDYGNECKLSGWAVPDYAWDIRFRPLGKPYLRDTYCRYDHEILRVEATLAKEDILNYIQKVCEKRSLHGYNSDCFFWKWKKSNH